MRIRNLIIAFLLMATVAGIAGCSADKASILAVLRENMNAVQAEDIGRVQATMDPNSPGYETTFEIMGTLFQMYDLKYEIVSMEVLEMNRTQARVRVVQRTKKVSGPAFADNETTAVNSLHKVNGKWLIYSTSLENTKMLNGS